MRKPLSLFALLWLTAWSVSPGPSLRVNQEPVAGLAYAQGSSFYQGKTIRIVVGSDSGGLYDLWARLFAKHMPRHIAGNPNMIVQNMPGAGGLAATNYLYFVAKHDGSHAFSTNINEHNHNVEIFQRQWFRDQRAAAANGTAEPAPTNR